MKNDPIKVNKSEVKKEEKKPLWKWKYESN